MKLREKYTKEIAPMLKEKLGFKSIMQVPKLEKITINMGVGEASNFIVLKSFIFFLAICASLNKCSIHW